MNETEVFVAAHGQDDNIGDPALRRAMLSGLAESSRRHVLVGSASPAYTTALGLRSDDVTYVSRREWQAAAFKAAARGRASYVSNAGEIQLNPRRRKINRADLALVSLIRARGGAAITTGLGVRDPNGAHSPILTALTRSCQITSWRDADSQRFARTGTVTPDWAFALGTATEHLSHGPRESLVISMRGDLPAPSPAWLELVSRARSRLGLRLQTVTQVERDRAQSIALASTLDADDMGWLGGDHLSAEAELRSIYRSAQIVISDRLHVLIFAATEGAIPIYVPNVLSTKIPRTLSVVGLDDYHIDPTADESSVERLESLAHTQAQVLQKVDAARQTLSALSAAMGALLYPGSTTASAASMAAKKR